MQSDSLFYIFGTGLADHNLIHGPSYYSFIWLFIGFIFVLAVGLIIFFILFSTRKKETKTISHLKPEQPKMIDIKSLREKYLKMISETERKFFAHEIKASVAHQELSFIVRSFYAEASGFHAEVLTLRDLKRSQKQYLAKVIEIYYPDEFNKLEKGAVARSAELAKLLITNDEAINRVKQAITTKPADGLAKPGDQAKKGGKK